MIPLGLLQRGVEVVPEVLKKPYILITLVVEYDLVHFLDFKLVKLILNLKQFVGH